jgi:YidC/Oxa1 family membrane protein insertase
VLNFLYDIVAWVLLRWHDLFTAIGMSQSSGWGWALSVVFLVITARLLLFRLFVKQVHYQRNMQKMQPKMKQLREKYKNDRAELNRQMMKFQQEEGFNPLAGCLPMFLQIPVFIGLYHVLRHLSNSVGLCGGSQKSHLLSLYTFSNSETCDAAKAQIFNAPLAASFHDSNATLRALGGDAGSTRILLVILLLISAGATFATQLLVRSNQTTIPEGTQATVQKAMIYLIPVGTLASGLLFRFPLGVLLYWFTSNLWTLGQQAYIIKFHPPTDEEAKPTGELGKTLAPRPGQRPVRMQKAQPAETRPVSSARNGVKSSSDSAAGRSTDSTEPSDRSSNPNSTAVPRPGQKPSRPNGKRPPAKRPTQAKKRR